MHKNNELETYCTDAVYIMFAPETDTDRVHPRIGSGQTYILPHVFVHYFPSFVFLLLSLNWPEQHRPVCSSR